MGKQPNPRDSESTCHDHSNYCGGDVHKDMASREIQCEDCFVPLTQLETNPTYTKLCHDVNVSHTLCAHHDEVKNNSNCSQNNSRVCTTSHGSTTEATLSGVATHQNADRDVMPIRIHSHIDSGTLNNRDMACSSRRCSVNVDKSGIPTTLAYPRTRYEYHQCTDKDLAPRQTQSHDMRGGEQRNHNTRMSSITRQRCNDNTLHDENGNCEVVRDRKFVNSCASLAHLDVNTNIVEHEIATHNIVAVEQNTSVATSIQSGNKSHDMCRDLNNNIENMDCDVQINIAQHDIDFTSHDMSSLATIVCDVDSTIDMCYDKSPRKCASSDAIDVSEICGGQLIGERKTMVAKTEKRVVSTPTYEHRQQADVDDNTTQKRRKPCTVNDANPDTSRDTSMESDDHTNFPSTSKPYIPPDDIFNIDDTIEYMNDPSHLGFDEVYYTPERNVTYTGKGKGRGKSSRRVSNDIGNHVGIPAIKDNGLISNEGQYRDTIHSVGNGTGRGKSSRRIAEDADNPRGPQSTSARILRDDASGVSKTKRPSKARVKPVDIINGPEHPRTNEQNSERIRNIRQNVINHLKRGDFSYDQFIDNPIIEAGVRFHEDIEKITWSTCINCKESGIDLNVGMRSGLCIRCRGVRAKQFGPENDLDPGVAPELLTSLTPVEKAAISIISPNISIYKGGLTSTSSKGHCVSFFQDIQQLATQLPHTPAELPIIVIKNPNERITDKTFTVRRNNILSALEFLQNNSPEYKDIIINQENALLYPEDDILQTIPSLNPTEINLPKEKISASNPESVVFGESTIDMAIAGKTVRENISVVVNEDQGDNPSTSHDINAPSNNQLNEAPPNAEPIEEQPNPIPWPKRQSPPASEFIHGFYSKAFPDLFPFGRGDITKPRIHKNPSLLNYFQHLMRLNRQFVQHHCFTFVATNIWRRHLALTLGNVFTKNSADGLTVHQLKESVNAGDDRVLKKLLYFAASIPGTRQHLRYQSDLALSFVDFIRIESNDTKMFNFFQTFSAADYHWYDLHRILPGSEAYLNKTVVPNGHVSAGGDNNDTIDEATDFRLRASALRNNADLVASLFRQRHLNFMNTSIKTLGMEDYIIRYEDQGRGSLHCHDLIVMSNGVSASDLKNAYKQPTVGVAETLGVAEALGVAETARIAELNEPIFEAMGKVVEFSTKVLGTSAVHPNSDPSQWPGPYGSNVRRPSSNCLRERFLNVYNEGRLKHQYELLINRTMLHSCRIGYCLDDKKRDKDGNLQCRFHFPERPIGFDVTYTDNGVEIESAVRNNVADCGAIFCSGDLKFLRNHPTLVHHIPELLTIWGANIEGRPVKSYEQVVKYVMKYLMKPEPNSAPFSSICKAVVDNADDNEPVKKSLQQVLMKTVGENDLSKQLCHHLLSDHPIVEFSRKPICVNVTTTRKIKQGARDAPAATENMADVYWRRETDTNYKKIQESYINGKIDYDPSELTLYEFASRYTKRWELSGDEKFPHITPNFNKIPRKEGKYPERYKSFLKMILIAHKAGTTFDEVEAMNVEDLETAVDSFCLYSERCPNVIKEKYEESQMAVFTREENEDSDDEGEIDHVEELLIEPERNQHIYDQEDWMEAMGPIVQNVDDLVGNNNADYNDHNIQDDADRVDWNEDRNYLNLSEQDLKNFDKWMKDQKQAGLPIDDDDITNGASPTTLNDKQLEAFAIIRQYILSVKREGIDNVDQLLLNISGGAGTGKSYFLRAVKRFAEETFQRSEFVVAAAISGTAAYIVDGETLHSLLCLPLDSNGYKVLQGDQLQDLQQRFRYIGILIIDEKSMIGQRVFRMIDRRLKEAKPHNALLPFGGLSVFLMGDWAQLPPVLDKSLFDSDTNCPEGFNLYALFEDAIIFDVIERQTDNVFKAELGRLSVGEFTIKDWNKWKSQSLQAMPYEEQREFHRDAVMACGLKKGMFNHNKERVIANGYPVAPMVAETNRSEARKESADNLCNLPRSIILSKNTTIRLSSNLWTKAGLTNGAVGVVRYIIYATGVRPPKLPVGIIATFDSYKGRPYLDDLPKSVAISPVRREFRSNGVSCVRIHLPIILGYALSIHRLQGNTLDKVILNIGEKEFAAGLTYVGASRVKSFEGLSISPFPNYERFQQIGKSKKLKRRLEEEMRIAALEVKTMEKYADAIRECHETYRVPFGQ